MSNNAVVRINPGDVTPIMRIGESGLYRTGSGEYARQFLDGFATVPYDETSLTVEQYPCRTEPNITYIGVVRSHIGPEGEYIDVRSATRKYRKLDLGSEALRRTVTAKCDVGLLDGFRFDGTLDETALAKRYLQRS